MIDDGFFYSQRLHVIPTDGVSWRQVTSREFEVKAVWTQPWEGRGARRWLGDRGGGGLRARGYGSLRVWVSRRMPGRKTLLQV